VVETEIDRLSNMLVMYILMFPEYVYITFCLCDRSLFLFVLSESQNWAIYQCKFIWNVKRSY